MELVVCVCERMQGQWKTVTRVNLPDSTPHEVIMSAFCAVVSKVLDGKPFYYEDDCAYYEAKVYSCYTRENRPELKTQSTDAVVPHLRPTG